MPVDEIRAVPFDGCYFLNMYFRKNCFDLHPIIARIYKCIMSLLLFSVSVFLSCSRFVLLMLLKWNVRIIIPLNTVLQIIIEIGRTYIYEYIRIYVLGTIPVLHVIVIPKNVVILRILCLMTDNMRFHGINTRIFVCTSGRKNPAKKRSKVSMTQ